MEVTHPHLCLVQSERWEQHEEHGAGGGSGQTWWWLSCRGHREGAAGACGCWKAQMNLLSRFPAQRAPQRAGEVWLGGGGAAQGSLCC